MCRNDVPGLVHVGQHQQTRRLCCSMFELYSFALQDWLQTHRRSRTWNTAVVSPTSDRIATSHVRVATRSMLATSRARAYVKLHYFTLLKKHTRTTHRMRCVVKPQQTIATRAGRTLTISLGCEACQHGDESNHGAGGGRHL